MRRRDLILGLAGAGSWRRALAQQPGRVYRVGLEGGASRRPPQIAAFLAGLARLGFVEGENLRFDEYYGLRPDQYAARAAALAREGVDLILCGGPPLLRAAAQATKTIPLIGADDDMVGEGFAKSMARPGGNVTGVSILASDLDSKRLQILLELLPHARRIGVLAGADSATSSRLDAVRDAARRSGVQLVVRTAQKSEDIAPALDALKGEGAEGVNVLASAQLFFGRRIILEHTAALRLPAIYQWPAYAGEDEGGLIGYGPDLVRIWGDQISRMAAQILRGAKPADLPIEQPTKFELIIDLKTAKALGLTVPPLLLAQADKVTE